MRIKTLVASAAIIGLPIVAACTPPPAVAPLPPQVGDPAYCGQTTDGTAVVTLTHNASNCPTGAGQKLILTYQFCGPTMQGSNAADDCYRGNVPGIPSPDVFRYGFITANGGQVINFVASDATAV
jgi:hypothetical protein